MRRIAVAVALLMLTGMAARAEACCMVPVGYRGDVDQSWQHAVLVHHDGHEELVLRIQPHFHGEEGPGFLEWVVTVPSPPTGYAVMDAGGGAAAAQPPRDPTRLLPPPVPRTAPRDVKGLADFCDEIVELHDHLQDLADLQYAARTRFEMPDFDLGAKGEAVPRAEIPATSMSMLHVEPAVVVGPFEITAVRARGRAGLDELNDYLEKRGFRKEDADHMRWFVDRDFTFLCIHITPPGEDDHVGKVLDLPALRIGFDAPVPYYPAKFSSRQGNFGLRLALVTSKPLEIEHLRDERQRLRGYLGRHRWENLWTVATPPRAIAEAFPEHGPHGQPSRWYLNIIDSEGFNPLIDGKPMIWSWKDDVFFPLGGTFDGPGLWYYGDRDLGSPERFAREHGIATSILIAIVLSVFFAWRMVESRRARRAVDTGKAPGGPQLATGAPSKRKAKRKAKPKE